MRRIKLFKISVLPIILGSLIILTIIMLQYGHGNKPLNENRNDAYPSDIEEQKKDKVGSKFSHIDKKDTKKVITAKKVLSNKEVESWWPDLKSLNKEEEKEFKIVENQAVRYYDWGSFDMEKISETDRALFKLSSRAVAHIARKLRDSNKANINTPSAAKDVINKIDTLRYLAESDIGNAKDAIEKLAVRAFEVQADGAAIDNVIAQVSLESFQIYAKIHPKKSQKFLETVPYNKRLPYAYHYYLGRKLAKEEKNQTIRTISSYFGEEIVDFMIQNKII